MAVIQSPKGTRDFYPREMLVRRYITDAWRRTALRHGFDEIDGPTFESAELYAVKSGEGILSEMFGVFSGKDPEDVERVKAGAPPLGLRPEFTPTLARMYAARAKQLPQPTKWFCVSNFFRAEKPQRGRLREFFQWNCDVIGSLAPLDLADDPHEWRGGSFFNSSEGECISCAVSALESLGVEPTDTVVAISTRKFIDEVLSLSCIPISEWDNWIRLLDKLPKSGVSAFVADATRAGMSAEAAAVLADVFTYMPTFSKNQEGANEQAREYFQYIRSKIGTLTNVGTSFNALGARDPVSTFQAVSMIVLWSTLLTGATRWLRFDPRIVRGLAYYTGTVFEVIAEGERAVAGGGRYDNLIELFGGPPTAACGFGMGDVVLANLLNDRGLMPEGRDLVEALCEPMPVRPDVFVVASPNERCDEAVTPLVSRLRRGVETERYAQSQSASDAAARRKPWDKVRYAAGEGGVRPLHARRSYKATKNVGKLLADAGSCFARWAAIVERVDDVAALEGVCTLKNMETQEQRADVPLKDVGRIVAR